ncbi:MAG TPA: hypothetical protein VGD64_07260 [Acidisarcina sp.]
MNRYLIVTCVAGALLSPKMAWAANDGLPNAPSAQSGAPPSGPDATSTIIDPSTIASAPSLFAKPDPTPLGQLGLKGKLRYYVQAEFGPANFVLPAVGALYRMANPPTNYQTFLGPAGVPFRIDVYPRAWKDGGGAFGRNYGDILASDFSEKTARFAVGAMLREEPRYFPSANRSFGARFVHAIGFTLIDKADSGHNRIAISNFAGAAAGGFVGDAYLPPGYRSLTHASQRAELILVGIAGENEAAEFRPEIRAILKKMHMPFIK